MNLYKITLVFFCSISTFNVFGQDSFIQTNEKDILGNWSILNSQIAVEISQVDGLYKGNIIWLAEPNSKSGLPKLDRNNLDKSKRSQGLLYLTCLYDFEYNPISNSFENGYFYNPLTGDTIKATLKLGENNTLIMSGFAGFSLTFEEETWVRM